MYTYTVSYGYFVKIYFNRAKPLATINGYWKRLSAFEHKSHQHICRHNYKTRAKEFQLSELRLIVWTVV